jgi:hypothetical protein
MEASAQCWRELSACCAMAMPRMSFSHGVVVMGASVAPVPCLKEEGRPEPPYSLEAMKNSSVESSIMAHSVGGPLWVVLLKMAPESLSLGERHRPLK